MRKAFEKKQDYKNAIAALTQKAKKERVAPEALALSVVESNRPLIERYVVAHGGKPDAKIAVLAAQAAIIHESKIRNKQVSGVPDYDIAEDAVLRDEEHLILMGDADNFDLPDGNLLGALLLAGKTAISKINEKRVAAGKKPILAGKNYQALKDKVETAQLEKPKTDAGIVIGEIKKAVVDHEKKTFVKENTPMILMGVLIIFLIGRNLKF